MREGSGELVRVGRQSVVAVGDYAVVLLARLLCRVHMDYDPTQVGEAVQEPVVDFSGYLVSLGHG